MVCKKCGMALADGVQFCASCGTPVDSSNNQNIGQVNGVYNNQVYPNNMYNNQQMYNGTPMYNQYQQPKKNNTALWIILGVVGVVFLLGIVGTIVGSSSKGFNDTIKFDDLEIVIKDNYTFTTVDKSYSSDYGKTVVKVPITIKNIGTKNNKLNMFYYNISGPNGVKVDATISLVFSNDSADYADDLKPGESYTKYLYFIYEGDGEYTIEFNNFINDKVKVKVDIAR